MLWNSFSSGSGSQILGTLVVDASMTIVLWKETSSQSSHVGEATVSSYCLIVPVDPLGNSLDEEGKRRRPRVWGLCHSVGRPARGLISIPGRGSVRRCVILAPPTAMCSWAGLGSWGRLHFLNAGLGVASTLVFWNVLKLCTCPFLCSVGKLKTVLLCCPEIFTMHQRDVDSIVGVLKEKCLFTVQQVTRILHRCPFVLREDPGELEYKFQVRWLVGDLGSNNTFLSWGSAPWMRSHRHPKGEWMRWKA